MTAGDKKIIAFLVEEGRRDGIHDTLVFIQDEINLKDLKIYQEGVEFANEPYGTTMYWDWTARCTGYEWPANKLEDEYRT
jgi:hypothetical protein